MNVEALEKMAGVVETYDPLSQDGEGRAVQQVEKAIPS
jgi:hypothetical protein